MFLFLDVETTGLTPRNAKASSDADWPHIVSASWAIFDAGKSRVLQRTCLVKPQGFSIPAESTLIHRISQQLALRHGQPLKQVLGALCVDIAQHKPQRLIAHNIEFDTSIMMIEFKRSRMTNPLLGLQHVCTMRMGCDRFGGKWLKLVELHATLFGNPHENAHAAEADVLACARCYFELAESSIPAIAEGGETHDETEQARDLIDRILAWASDQPNFDTTFVEELEAQLDSRGSLTDRQIAALENIVEKWHVP